MKSMIFLLIVTLSSLIEASKFVIRVKPEETHHSHNYPKYISYPPSHEHEYTPNRHHIHSDNTRPKPHQITIEKRIPYHVYKSVPYPVRVPYRVPVIQKIIVPVPHPYEVPVYRPYTVEVPHQTIVEKKVPVYINGGKSREQFKFSSDSDQHASGCSGGHTRYEYPKPPAGKITYTSSLNGINESITNLSAGNYHH